jgi:hypothetical protein
MSPKRTSLEERNVVSLCAKNRVRILVFIGLGWTHDLAVAK